MNAEPGIWDESSSNPNLDVLLLEEEEIGPPSVCGHPIASGHLTHSSRIRAARPSERILQLETPQGRTQWAKRGLALVEFENGFRMVVDKRPI